MTIKKAHTFTKIDVQEAPAIDQEFNTIYQNKLESRFSVENGTATLRSYQSVVHGYKDISATGSASVDFTAILPEPVETVISVAASAKSAGIIASVTDFTATTITVRAAAISGLFSATTSATVRVYWNIVVAQP